jgi:hypothetical protein
MQWYRFNDSISTHYQKIKRRHRSHLDSMRRKRDMGWWCVDVNRRRNATEEGKWRRWGQLSLRESYYAKNWKKSMQSIQLLEIGDEDLKQRWVNLIFLNILKWDLVLFISSCRTQWWKYNFKCISYEWDKLFLNFVIVRNDVAHDVEQILTWHDLIGCRCEYLAC